jgi:hypothetical protein
MAIKLTTTARNSLATVLINAIDAGGAGGGLKIYSGTQPASPSVAPTGTILSEHTLSYPCGTATSGVLVFDGITDDNFANATGVATWARFFDSTGAAVADCSVSVSTGSGDIKMNTVNIVENGPVRFTSLQWTMPGG